ncbi:MAG TPA: haloacid dehalogenase type II [Microvirga sp.]|jgi:2-haloacid dehalogenase
MSPSPDLLSHAEAVVFDAYGTLFDVHSAVARHAASIGPEAARLSEIWRAKQLEYSWVLSLADRYEPFWTLTERALDHAFARCPGVDQVLRPRLLDAYRSLDAYGEVADVLRALRARGLKTGILSNGDPAMLRDAVASAGLGGALDAVLSVEEAGVFKTSPRTYALIEASLAAAPAGTVFVSSNRWDIAGAAAFGLRPVWVNRLGLPDEYPGLEPVAVVGDLRGLVG